MKKKGLRVYLRTYGCQMNKYDSSVVLELLQRQGYEETPDPKSADLILLNTCSVREHAENRAIARAKNLSHLKRRKPDLLLGIIGCIAQSRGAEILREAPAVDLVVGPDCYRDLPELVEGLRGSGRSAVVKDRRASEMYGEIEVSQTGVCEFLPIMKGCDNFCSYCVVPYTRGREQSRPADEIVEEVRRLKESGTKDITLLGQNVNSYSHGNTDFCALLRMVNGIAGSVRIRFITSHPRDFGRDLVETVADCKSICEHIHLPLQSGSTRILQSMNRGYSFEEYMGKVEVTRSLVPGVAFSTDLLVGFPGETEQDFLLTLCAVEKIGFDFAYMFAYSRRQGTKASTLGHEVPRHVKHERLRELISRQNRITAERNRALVSTITEVLVEGVSSKDPKERVGRTRTGKSVVFRGDADLGDLAVVEVEELKGWTPYGRVLESRGKGGADVRHL